MFSLQAMDLFLVVAISTLLTCFVNSQLASLVFVCVNVVSALELTLADILKSIILLDFGWWPDRECQVFVDAFGLVQADVVEHRVLITFILKFFRKFSYFSIVFN